MSDPDATAMVVVIAGGRHMQGKATVAAAMARGCRVNTTVAAMGDRSMRVIAAMATARKACRGNTTVVVCSPSTMVIAAIATGRASRLNTRIIPAIAAMVALGGDRTLSVTVTVAVAKAVRGSRLGDSLPAVAVAAGSDVAQVADARAGDAKRRAAEAANGARGPMTRADRRIAQAQRCAQADDAHRPDDARRPTTRAPCAAQIAPCHPLTLSV